MAAEIIGLDKIVKYMDRFDFQKIKLSKGSEVIYIKRIKEGETQADLVNDFTTWVEDFIDDNNFRDYKLELLGSYNTDPSAKLSPVVKVVVAFHHREAATTAGLIKHSPAPSQPIDVNSYVAVATENATLKAQLARMEEKMDELIYDDDEDEDEVGAPAPATFTEAINNALIGKIDTIVDVVLGMIAKQNMPQNTGISGIDSNDILDEFKQIHPEIEDDLARLLKLAKTQPDFFKMLIGQLRKMV
jgi:hypothetical protein